MQTASPSPTDEGLYNLVSGSSLATIPDVIARMQAIDALLRVTDGLKWFNRLYLMVTQQVDLCPPGGAWQSPVWLDRLDVVFTGFFRAVADYLSGTCHRATSGGRRFRIRSIPARQHRDRRIRLRSRPQVPPRRRCLRNGPVVTRRDAFRVLPKRLDTVNLPLGVRVTSAVMLNCAPPPSRQPL